MRKKTLWITQTAVMLAMLIALQAITKTFGQIVTGSCVNAILAMTALVCGTVSSLTVALLSPIFAFMLGIAPNLATVPAIMAGNAVFVLLINFIYGKQTWRHIVAWLTAAVAKFIVLYILVVWVICGVAAESLLAQGILKAPMLTALPAAFSWTQLITALIGGGAALLTVPVLRKALRR